MPVSLHTEDNRSPRSELLSPTSGSSASPPIHFQRAISSIDGSGSRSRSHSQSTSQSQSPATPSRERERRHRNLNHHSTQRNGYGHTNGHTNNGQSSRNGNNNKTSKSWWRNREQELQRSDISKQDLIRMIISAERETSKLHSTLTNTLTLLDVESQKSASLERDSLTTFTHLTSLRETAESLAERTAQDLRVAQFELEHKTREVERLKRELDIEKLGREEVEREVGRVKDEAWKIRRERIMDKAREEGRREGFEKGFMKAQAENVMKLQMRAEGQAVANPRAATQVANAAAGPSSGSGFGSGSGSGQRSGPLPPPAVVRVPRTEQPQVPAQNDQPPEESDEDVHDDDEESPFQELNSLPIITPPQGTHTFPNGHKVPMKTGYSPTRRPVPRQNIQPEHERAPSRGPTPLVDHYPVSIPSQRDIEQITNIKQPEEWVTGAEHSALHGPTPPQPATLIINANTSHDGQGAGPSSAGQSSAPPETPVSARPTVAPSSSGGKSKRVNFRRPSLSKTKQTAVSWYRNLSFRKKPKQKVLIDPALEEEVDGGAAADDEVGGPESASGHGHTSAFSHGHTSSVGRGGGGGEQAPLIRTQASSHGPPPIANVGPSSHRHSRAASASASMTSAGKRARNYAYPPTPAQRSQASQGQAQEHKPRVTSFGSASTYISTSQFDLLSAPGNVGGGGYSRGGPANTSTGSVNSLGTAGGGGKAQSVSGRSARSQGGGIGKKLSVIRENPTSRDTTPIRPTFHEGGQEQPLEPPVRPFAANSVDADRRSMKSARSTNNRMVAVNPDPESPDWPNMAGVGPSSIRSGQRGPYTHPVAPVPEGSALLRPDPGVGMGGGGSNSGLQFPVIQPLRTKKSGLSGASGGSASIGGSVSNGAPVDTPTPLPKGNKGKGKERAYPPGGTMMGEDMTPEAGIGIAVRPPSDTERVSGHRQSIPQDADYLSPKQSSIRSLSRSGRGGTSLATSTTRVAGHDEPPIPQQPQPQQPFPRSISPIPRSTPKIFQAQGLPGSTESVLPFEEAKKPKVTVIRRIDPIPGVAGSIDGGKEWTNNNAGMTPGPTLFHPLPSRAARQNPPSAQESELLQPAPRLQRSGSDASLRSQGSYGKFDASTYVDPAFWNAPVGGVQPPVQVQVAVGVPYARPVSRGAQSVESKRISYADP